MKEHAVLVILKAVVNLLVPYDTPIRRLDAVSFSFIEGMKAYRYIDKLQPECVADKVVGKDHRALQACINPSAIIGPADVQLGDRNSVYLIGSFGDCPLDCLPVLSLYERRHFSSLRLRMVEVGSS